MSRPLLLVAAVLGAHALSGCAATGAGSRVPPPVTTDRDTIRAFSSQEELADFIDRLFVEGKREYDREQPTIRPRR